MNGLLMHRCWCWTAGLVFAGFLAVPPASAQRTRSASDEPEDHNIPQVSLINREIRQGWNDYQIRPSSPAAEGEWCRRVYLDLIGRIPSVEELDEFTSSRESNKRLALVNRLLEDERYTEDYARNWTTIFTNLLIGRTGGTERNSLTNRAGMQKYLRDSFARNKPYDRMVYELVTATGTTTPGMENFNGATNFLAMKVNDENGALATAQTAKIFLGLQVQCTQCHNHPFNEWKQQKFWEFNAFFRQTRANPIRNDGDRRPAGAELVNQVFNGENNNVDDAVIFYELRNGILKSAYPVFVDGTASSRSGDVKHVVRRDELGKLIAGSELLSQAMVNRMWGHFFGYGFTKPVDDLGPHNDPTHPTLLAELARNFTDQSYNLKDLMRWMVLSEAYSLSSRTNPTNVEADDPQLGVPPKFSRFYLRHMTAEQLYESLLVATQAHKTRGSYEQQEETKSRWMQQFVTAFGNDEGEEATDFNGTIPQALMMFNGELIRRATSKDQGSFLWDVAHSATKPGDKIAYLFKAALARSPSKTEISAANTLLVLRQGDGVGALQDLWWAILNSNEFIINH